MSGSHFYHVTRAKVSLFYALLLGPYALLNVKGVRPDVLRPGSKFFYMGT